MTGNQLKLAEILTKDSECFDEFSSLSTLNEMYDYASELVKDITEQEFIDFMIECVCMYKSTELKNLSENETANIAGYGSNIKSKFLSYLILPLTFAQPLNAVNIPENNYKTKSQTFNLSDLKIRDHINMQSLKKSKLLNNKLVKIGAIALPLTVLTATSLVAGRAIYKNSDNFFQRQVIGDIKRLKILRSASEDVKWEYLSVSQKLEGKIYTASKKPINNTLNGKYVIFYSGNGRSNSVYVFSIAKWYTDRGAKVIGVDYRGFGESEERKSSGEIRQKDIYSDAQEIYEYTKSHFKLSPSDIIIHGYSLGGVAAAHVAANASEKGENLCGLILQSSIKNSTNAAKIKLKEEKRSIFARILGTSWVYLFADQFDCEKELKRIFKFNPKICVALCSGNGKDGLSLENTSLDEVAENLNFSNLTVFKGTEGHENIDYSAPIENFILPKDIESKK